MHIWRDEGDGYRKIKIKASFFYYETSQAFSQTIYAFYMFSESNFKSLHKGTKRDYFALSKKGSCGPMVMARHMINIELPHNNISGVPVPAQIHLC